MSELCRYLLIGATLLIACSDDADGTGGSTTGDTTTGGGAGGASTTGAGGDVGSGGNGGAGGSPVMPVDCSTVTCYYVREAADPDGAGTDWATAFVSLPEELERGAVYLVADGSYPSYTFDDPNDGEETITVRKALVADHGTETGWLDEYGDEQAVFSDILLVTDYIVFDGAKRNESDWTDGASYGFRNTGSFYSNTANFGSCSSEVTIRFVDVGGPFGPDFHEGATGAAFYFGGFDELCTHWTISRVFAHNVGIVGQMAGVDSIVWEYSWLGLNWSKEILRSQLQGSNVTIRHNVFKDGCRDDHAPGTGCTAEIAFFGNAGSPDENYDNARIYGNVIHKTLSQHNGDGTIMIQNANGGIAYNNTIVNDSPSGLGIISMVGTGSAVRNNVSYFPSGMLGGCAATTCDNNTIYTDAAPPFVDVAGGDFHLTRALDGASLDAPYDTDLEGTTRGLDGVFDQGAFEYP
jgi:hypothetical protein